MKRIYKPCLFVVVTCLFLALPRAQVQRSDSRAVTAIVGGTLIDGTGKQPIQDSVVVIEGNTFKSVGEKGKVSYPQSAKTIDAAGKFIIPGLIDAHVHYRDFVPELFLAHGVTSIEDMGNPTDWILAQRDGIAKGKIIGPRIFAAGDAITVGATVANRVGRGVKTPEEARKVVREHAARGLDKIAAIGAHSPAVMAAIVDEAHKAGLSVTAPVPTYPREAIEAGIDALEHSYSVGAASKKDPAVLQAIRRERGEGGESKYEANPFNLLMEPEFDDLIQLMVQKGTYTIPSLIFEYKLIHDHRKEFEQEYYQILTNPNLRYFPFEDYFPMSMSYSYSGITRAGGTLFGTLDRQGGDFERYRQGYKNLQNFLRKLMQAGGKVLAGTDAPNLMPPGITLHQELQLLADAGLTPMQVIMTATKSPAEFLRKQNQLGTIEAGKLADLLILRADPLQDITNTRKIEMVIKDGQVLDTSYHADFVNPIPRTVSAETEPNQIPILTDISPRSATEGDAEVTLAVEGRDFEKASVVVFDGQWVPTTFVKGGQLRATIAGRLLNRPGTFVVTVWTPRPGGGMSGPIKFVVRFR